MGVGQLSESDAVDALRLPFYSSSHPTGSHGWRNQFDLGNPDLKVSSPPELISKSAASSPSRDQVIVALSGSVAELVATGPVPFSA